MSKHKKYIQSILLLFLLFSFTNDYRFLLSLPVEASFLTTDHLRNVYVITEKNELIKYDLNGQQLATFSDKQSGKLQAVDASNPLRLVLFYPEFSQVLVLDNMLTRKAVYDLKHIGIFNVSAVCFSHDNNIWIYDERTFKLKKIDGSLKVIQESEMLNALIHPDISPHFLLERNNYVYLSDPQLGIFVFDIYGTYYKRIPLKGISTFQIVDEQLVYFKENKLHSYHLQTLHESTVLLPDTTNVQSVRIEKNRLYLLKENAVALYAF